MKFLQVNIVEYIDDSNPGWVKCTFRDANQKEWIIIEKVPVVTEQYLNATSNYPQVGFVACEITAESFDANNKLILYIDTSKPWGVEEKGGQTRFEVYETQIKKDISS